MGRVTQTHIAFVLFIIVALLGAIVLKQNNPLFDKEFESMQNFCNEVHGQYYISTNGSRGSTAGCIYPAGARDVPYLPPS